MLTNTISYVWDTMPFKMPQRTVSCGAYGQIISSAFLTAAHGRYHGAYANGRSFSCVTYLCCTTNTCIRQLPSRTFMIRMFSPYDEECGRVRSRSRDVGMEEESEDDEDGKFLDEEEDEEVYEMQHEEEDELMDHGSDEGDVHGESDDDKEDDDEVELSDSHDDENEVDDNLERFQKHFLHKNMPNMLYMDAAYTELCMF